MIHAALDLRPDARRLVMNAPNGDLTLWDTTDPALPQRSGRLRHRSRFVAAAWNPFLPDSLVTATHDGTVLAWRLTGHRQPEPAARWTAPSRRPRHVGWVARGRWMFSVSADGHVAVWDVDGGRLIAHLDVTGGRRVIAAHHSGNKVVVIVDGGWARLWDPRRPPGEWIRLTGEPVAACAWSESLLVLAGTDGRVACFDTDFQRLGTMPFATEPVLALAVTPDHRLVAAFPGGRLIATDLSGTVLWRTSSRGYDGTSLSLAGSVIAVGSGMAHPVLLTLPD